jgi:hypothetical protein
MNLAAGAEAGHGCKMIPGTLAARYWNAPIYTAICLTCNQSNPQSGAVRVRQVLAQHGNAAGCRAATHIKCWRGTM